jgi:hypothetical protein
MSNFNQPDNRMPVIKRGFLDHGDERCCVLFPLQKPRHFRFLLSFLSFAFIFTSITTFFTGVAGIGSMDAGTAWERLHHPSFPNDAAIFFPVGQGGDLTMRLCSGSVRWTCSECSSDSRIEPKENSSKHDSSPPSLFSSSSSSLSSRRYEDVSGHPNDCECGADIKWNDCPLVTNGVAANLNCASIQQLTREVYPDLILWIGLALGLSGTLWIVYLPAVSCMQSKNWRYKRPIAACFTIFFTGVVVPVIEAVIVSRVADKMKVVATEQPRCTDGATLSQKGFYTTGITDVYRSAVAALVVTAGSAVFHFLGLLFVVLCPRPKSDCGVSCLQCCYVTPHTPEDEAVCCCDEDDNICQEWFGKGCCKCCECCDNGENFSTEDAGCCICYNDFEDGVDEGPISTQQNNNNNNNNDPTTNTNFPPFTFNSVPPTYLSNGGIGPQVEMGVVVANPPPPPSYAQPIFAFGAPYGHQQYQHHNQFQFQQQQQYPAAPIGFIGPRVESEGDDVSVNSDDNPEFHNNNNNNNKRRF